jgi:DinB superfamily
MPPELGLLTGGGDAPDWLDALAAAAPDPVAAYRNIEAGKFITVRREIRRRMTTGAAATIVPQLAALAAAIDAIVARLPAGAFDEPGGEGDWTVGETIGHDAHARAGLSLAGALAASGRWPADAPVVVPGVPGSPGASREELRRRIALSQRAIERAARAIQGHETEACPLEHPWVGRLRCGEWLLFAGVHDLMHLEQLHDLEARFVPRSAAVVAPA